MGPATTSDAPQLPTSLHFTSSCWEPAAHKQDSTSAPHSYLVSRKQKLLTLLHSRIVCCRTSKVLSRYTAAGHLHAYMPNEVVLKQDMQGRDHPCLMALVVCLLGSRRAAS